jgi:hypothetical protein
MAIKWVQNDGTSKVEFTGAVVSLRECNGYSDSDFFALVYDPASAVAGSEDVAQRFGFREIEYSTTRCACQNGAWVDADLDVLKVYKEMCEVRQNEARAKAAALDAATPRKGRMIEVVKGRKLPHGTKGEVFWYGQSKFGGYSVGFITDSGEKHFTNANNVKVIQRVSYENYTGEEAQS